MKVPLLLQEMSLTSLTAKIPVFTASTLLSTTGGCPALRHLSFCSRLPSDLKSVPKGLVASTRLTMLYSLGVAVNACNRCLGVQVRSLHQRCWQAFQERNTQQVCPYSAACKEHKHEHESHRKGIPFMTPCDIVMVGLPSAAA